MFLRGRFLLHRGWPEIIRESVEILSRAHAAAPNDPRIGGTYALALARSYGMSDQGRDIAEQARDLATRVAELDPMQAEAKVALGLVHLQDQEADAAQTHFRNALAVAPNSVDALDWLGRLMGEVGLVDEGVALLQRATEVDPETIQPRFQIARIRSLFRDRPGVLSALGPMPEHPADIAPWIVIQARDALWYGDQETAARLDAILRTLPLPASARFPIESLVSVVLGPGVARVRNSAEVERMLPIDGTRAARRATFNAQIRVELFMSVGMQTEALASLRDAAASGLFDILWLDRCLLLDPLRGAPEFSNVREHVSRRAQRIAASILSKRSYVEP